MPEEQLLFNQLKNLTRSKVPLVYKTAPSALLNQKKLIPKSSEILHPFFQISDVDMATIALSSNKQLLDGLRVPVKTPTGKDEINGGGSLPYSMKFLTAPKKNADIIQWVSEVNEVGYFKDCDTYRKLIGDEKLFDMKAISVESPKQVKLDSLFANSDNITIESMEHLFKHDFQVSLSSNDFENLTLFSIQNIPARNIGIITELINNIFLREVQDGRAVSNYYSDLFVSALVNRILDTYKTLSKTEKADIERHLELLINQISLLAAQSSEIYFNEIVLNQLFGFYVKVQNLPRAKQILFVMLSKKVLPSNENFLSYVSSAYSQSSEYSLVYTNGLKNVFKQYLSGDLVNHLLSDLKYITEVQLLLNFVDQGKPIRDQVYQQAAAKIVAQTVNILSRRRANYTSRERSAHLVDVLFRLENRKAKLDNGTIKLVVKHFVSQLNYRSAYRYIEQITDQDKSFFATILADVLTKKPGHDIRNSHKAELIGLISQKLQLKS